MPIALAFDVYGTLADTAALAESPLLPPSDGGAFAAKWRAKQLEYSFRRALMRRYAPFSQCTKDALNYVCAERGGAPSAEQRAELLAEYETLPAFADAAESLRELGKTKKLFAFSNGETAAVQKILRHNKLDEFFADIVSADEIQTYKPDPAIYAHFLRRAQTAKENTWLISANPFDIIGACAAGWKTAWLNRGAPFDPWDGFAPDVEANSLTQLAKLLP